MRNIFWCAVKLYIFRRLFTIFLIYIVFPLKLFAYFFVSVWYISSWLFYIANKTEIVVTLKGDSEKLRKALC